MKKWLTVILLLQSLAFLVITYYKYAPKLQAEISDNKNREEHETPDDLMVWEYFNKATDYRISGAYQKAIQYYKLALEIDSTHQNSLYYLGNLHMMIGNYGKAERSWEQLVKVNPYSSRGHTQLGTLYCYRASDNNFYDMDKSINHFKRAVQLNKEETGPLLELAKIDLINEQIDAAAVKLGDVLSSNFRSTEALFLQGYLSWKNGDLKQTKLHLEKCLSIIYGTNTKLANVGEGDTKEDGNSIQANATHFRLFTEHINHLLYDVNKVTDKQIDQVYTQFEHLTGLDALE